MPAFVRRSNGTIGLAVAFVCCALVSTSVAGGYLSGDDDDDPQPSGFGQTDPSDAPGEVHYHFHNHYHSPYLSQYDSGGTPSAGMPGFGANNGQPFAPNGVAGANRYYTPGYLKAGRTPLPSTPFLGNHEDAGPNEDMDSTDSDEASSNDEVGENVDQPATGGYARQTRDSSQAGEIVDQPSYAFGPRSLPGDRGYLRVIVPTPNTKLIYDGHEVAGSGLLRSLMTARIQPGQSLVYSLVAYWKDPSGNPRASAHEAAIGAGDHQNVQFNVAAPSGD
jgi:hypothetical protein